MDPSLMHRWGCGPSVWLSIIFCFIEKVKLQATCAAMIGQWIGIYKILCFLPILLISWKSRERIIIIFCCLWYVSWPLDLNRPLKICSNTRPWQIQQSRLFKFTNQIFFLSLAYLRPPKLCLLCFIQWIWIRYSS